ncbi:hypothetical protein ACFL3G_13665 [Planctomycetota bacterium]
MTILTANLKHLYQRRAAWLWYFVIICMTPVVLFPLWLTELDRYLGYLIISMYTGLLAGGLQKDVLNKPFSFCLPGHRRIARPFFFWVGGVVNLILGLVFLGYPGLEFPYVLLVILAGGFVGMIVYFYAIYLGFQAKPSPKGGGFPLLVFGAIFLKWDMVVQEMIVSSPLIIIAIGFLSCWLAWKQLGRDDLARKFCGKLTLGIFGAWNRQKLEKFRIQQDSKKNRKFREAFSNSLETVSHNCMQRFDFLSTGRYICGNIYTVLGWSLRMVKPGVAALFILGAVVYFGYLGSIGKGSVKHMPLMMTGFLYIIPALLLTNVDLLSCQSLLLPAGRRQKFLAMLASAVVLTLLGSILLLTMTGISFCLQGRLPDISWHGLEISYHALNIRLLPLFVVFIPTSFCISVLFRKNHMLRIIIMIVLMQIIIFSGVISSFINLTFGPVSLAMLAVGLWGVFVYILHHVCTRRPLVTQTG